MRRRATAVRVVLAAGLLAALATACGTPPQACVLNLAECQQRCVPNSFSACNRDPRPVTCDSCGGASCPADQGCCRCK